MRSDFYIDINGNDQNPGTEEYPFSTFKRAKEEVRKAIGTNTGPITVWVKEGTYYLEEPIIFSPEDSGTANAPIVYKAYPGHKPVISGGKKIEGKWKHYKDGIWMCELPKIPTGKWSFSQLFINGKRQIRARFPKYDPSVPGRSGYIHPAKAQLEWPHTYIKYDPETFTDKRWANPKGAILHIFPANYWGNLQWRIEDIDWDSHTIKLGEGGFQINDIMQGRAATGIDHRSLFFIENIFEELSLPGEWYLDSEKGILYVIPEEDIDLNSALVEVSYLKQVVKFKGTQQNPVHHITLSGFRIAHTETTYLDEYEAPSLGDWAIHRGGALFFEGAEDCIVEKCFFDAVGGNAIFLNNYNRRNNIYGNIISEAGDSGICLVGSKHLCLGSNHAYPAENIIKNNLIHDIGVFGKQTAGVFISVSRDNLVSHNYIYNVPRAAICINDGTWGGHIIEYNDIHDTVRETGDHGPFNSWGRDRYWCLQQSHGPVSHGAGDVKKDAQKTVIIRNNRFRDYRGWGIDLDDGSSNYHIYNNLCIGISIKLREGDYRIVENNIFVNCANPPGFHIGYEYNHDRFERNIIYMNSKYDNPEIDIDFQKGKSRGNIYEIIGPPLRGPWLEYCDNNLFFNDIGEFRAAVHYRPLGQKTVYYNLDEWRELGLDLNSVYADPLFVNPEQGDYRLMEESPAFKKIGFKEFPMDKFGLLDDFSENSFFSSNGK